MSQIASFYLLKDGRRQELSNGDCSGAVYMAIWDWCESELELCGSRTSRSWPLKLPRTGICPPRRCKAGLKRCAPIWNWCRATLPCCMR